MARDPHAPSSLRFVRALAGLPALALPVLTAALAPVGDAHAQSVDERYDGGDLDRRCPRRQPRSGSVCAASSARAQVGCHYGSVRPSALCNCRTTGDRATWRCRSFGRPPFGPLPPPELFVS